MSQTKLAGPIIKLQMLRINSLLHRPFSRNFTTVFPGLCSEMKTAHPTPANFSHRFMTTPAEVGGFVFLL